jgi:hypothetical protein
MLVDDFKMKITSEADLLCYAINSIRLNNMPCLQYFTDKGAVPKLTVAGIHDNIPVLEHLIKCGANDYADVFDDVCRLGHMKFVTYMLEKYVSVININEGFKKLNLDNRIEFMEMCLKLQIKFDANQWFMDTCRPVGKPDVVHKWMLDHLEISEKLRNWYAK